jgi:hypothetical protein
VHHKILLLRIIIPVHMVKRKYEIHGILSSVFHRLLITTFNYGFCVKTKVFHGGPPCLLIDFLFLTCIHGYRLMLIVERYHKVVAKGIHHHGNVDQRWKKWQNLLNLKLYENSWNWYELWNVMFWINRVVKAQIIEKKINL